ncbi:MAG: aspartyl protease family protein [Gemmataceae bacterium]
MTVRACAALLVFAIAAPLWADTPPAPVTVPIEMLEKDKFFSGHFAVQVKVNGKGPYKLIFDTGAPMILLSRKIGKDCDLFGGKGKKAPAAGLFAMPGQSVVESLDVGGVTAKDVPAMVMDHPTVQAISDVFGTIDGLVGFPFFARYKTAIDYQAKTLTMTPNGFKPTDTMQNMMKTMTDAAAGGNKPKPKILVPAGQWGLRVEKPADDEDDGVNIAEVLADSAAAKAGVKAGDRLLTLDGRWTDSIADVFHAAAAIKPGQAVEAVVKRDGKKVPLTVAPAAGQ